MQSARARGRLNAGALLLSLFFTGICSGAAPCRLDAEEYAVYSAVLFAKSGHGQQKPAAAPSDILSPPSELAGVWPGPYTVSSTTLTVSAEVLEGKDAALLKNFNRKNTQACQIEMSPLAAALPEANRSHVRIAFNDENTRQGGVAGGIVRLSRVGFNPTKTTAVVEIHAIYDPEAGVGYRAFLQRATPDGKWRLQDVVKTRQF